MSPGLDCQVLAEDLAPLEVAWGPLGAHRSNQSMVFVEGLDLPEGSMVTILTTEPDGEVYLSPEEEEAILESMAEAERGETISVEELFARLDRNAKL